MQKTIFITGASTGLGRATAHLFARHGFKVIATMRRTADGASLANDGITVLPLDVTNLEQIERAAATALGHGGVDVLFNNAGYGLAGPLEGTTDEQVRRQLDTNLLGTIRTTQAFLQHFREKGHGTVITTTSIGGLVTFPFFSVYHATKWALEGWNESMAFEMRPFGVRMKTVAPGGIQSDFASRSLVLAQHPEYAALIQKAFATFADPERRARASTAEQIAETVYEAATDGKDQRRYVAGGDAQEIWAQRNEVGSERFHDAIAARFFG